MGAYEKSVSAQFDYDELDAADDAIKTLLIGSLHDEAPDFVVTWSDVPACIKAQWDATRGLIEDWSLNNLDVLEDRDNPPAVHVNWSARVPDGQIPWGDNPTEGGYFPMGVTLQMEWVDPSVLIDRPSTFPPVRS